MDTSWREELAWAAGFFDGEGSTGFNDPIRKYGRMSIHQVDRRSLFRFRAAVLDRGTIRGPYDKDTGQPISLWECTTFQTVQAVLAMLWPFLGEAKKEQAKPVLYTMNFSPPRQEFADDRTYVMNGRTCRQAYEFCKNGKGPHRKTPANTTKWGQCRECMRIFDRARRPPGSKR